MNFIGLAYRDIILLLQSPPPSLSMYVHGVWRYVILARRKIPRGLQSDHDLLRHRQVFLEFSQPESFLKINSPPNR